MSKLHYLKWPFVVIALGVIIWIFASMMKILHWVNGDIAIVLGTGVMIAGVLFLIVKLIALKK